MILIIEKSGNKTDKHEEIKNLILNKLNDLNIKYKIILSKFIYKEDFSEYNLIMSLGGDGTFLDVAKQVTNQLIIGVNSDSENSIGYLTEFNDKNILDLLLELENKNYKIKKLNRLGIFINGKKIKNLAVNEIFIGNTDIRKVSHLDVDILDKKSYVRGNGIIISTKQGSNAFYKSAGGKIFSTDSIGYVFVLPYKIEGELSENKILDLDTLIKIIPKRSNHTVSFDSDIINDYKLEKDDVVEVLIDKKNSINIISSLKN